MSMDFSIVEYYAEHEGYRCGYCKSTDTNYSHGMWAHMMTVEDYQDLIDRGWRRSGMYCYKPTMDRTCCPMYTIRCAALDLKLSRSQKKVLKRMNAFLSRGETQVDRSNSASKTSRMDICYDSDIPGHRAMTLKAEISSAATKVVSVDEAIQRTEAVINASQVPNKSKVNQVPVMNVDSSNISADTKNLVRQGGGSSRDESRPPRRKAKLLRLERKQRKLMSRGYTEEEAMELIRSKKRPANNQGKSLEEFLAESAVQNPAHKLEIRLVQSQPQSQEFQQTADEAYRLYCKYQIAVHGDPPEKCTQHQYTRFLVRSPLQPWRPSDGPPSGFGSFHQQYWLDGRLIAVGVIDILPRCVSSVYFYYDPEFSQLSLGTYASLRELEFTRAVHQSAPSLQYYYMGFYIHSCPKMRYKASYSPSFLLCPETYRWYPVELCRPLLDEHKYSRFCDDHTVVDPDGYVVLSQVLVLWKHTAIRFCAFASQCNPDSESIQEVEQYAHLVGMTAARRMLLLRP